MQVERAGPPPSGGTAVTAVVNKLSIKGDKTGRRRFIADPSGAAAIDYPGRGGRMIRAMPAGEFRAEIQMPPGAGAPMREGTRPRRSGMPARFFSWRSIRRSHQGLLRRAAKATPAL